MSSTVSVQLDALGREQAMDSFLLPGQQHVRRSLGRRGGAGAGRIAEAQALTVLDEYSSILSPDLIEQGVADGRGDVAAALAAARDDVRRARRFR